MVNSSIQNRINTIFVHVSDLHNSVKWYSDLLGQDYDLTEVTRPVYNLSIDHHTGLTLDAGPTGVVKQNNPTGYPLFNFHTDDIKQSYEYIKQLGYKIEEGVVHFDDFSYFTISDPDHNIVMICTG